MTLAELLGEDEITSSATVSEVKSDAVVPPQYVPDVDVDKLASMIESFADKYETILQEIDNTLNSKTALFNSPEKKNSKIAVDHLTPAELKNLDATSLRNHEGKLLREEENLRAALKLERLQNRTKALREGRTLHPAILPLVLGGAGGAALMHTINKQKAVSNMAGGA